MSITLLVHGYLVGRRWCLEFVDSDEKQSQVATHKKMKETAEIVQPRR